RQRRRRSHASRLRALGSRRPGRAVADAARRGLRRSRPRVPAMTLAAPTRPPTKSPYSHRQIVIMFCGLGLGMFLAALDQTIVSTALPTITGDLGGLSHLSWVVTSYLLATTVSTPLYGKLGDIFGRKQLFQIAIFIFLVGSMLSGLAQSMEQLIAFRAVQGLGAGGLMVLAMA